MRARQRRLILSLAPRLRSLAVVRIEVHVANLFKTEYFFKKNKICEVDKNETHDFVRAHPLSRRVYDVDELSVAAAQLLGGVQGGEREAWNKIINISEELFVPNHIMY